MSAEIVAAVEIQRENALAAVLPKPKVFHEAPLTRPNTPSEVADLSPAEILDLAHEKVRSEVAGLLSTTARLVESDGHVVFVRDLMQGLQTLRDQLDRATWTKVAVPAARQHPLAAIVQECAFTSHSYRRPRGYPGDAGLLDLVYRHESARAIIEGLSEGGRQIFEITTGCSASESVRRRREVIARRLDAVTAEREGAEILAVACGHAREHEFSHAMQNGRFGRFVLTDQDTDSLAVARDSLAKHAERVEARQLSVRDFVIGNHALGTFDFIYASGLYDYLDARNAARLTRKLFALLKPGGRLLVANLLEGLPEEAYMEVYMDWHLIYRDETKIRAFADEISELDLRDLTYSADDAGRIGYLELVRA